jgi:SAM-dependent methyltransferase
MAATIAIPYSRLAADYDATIGIPFFRQTRESFERLVRKYGISFRSAADIGCGTGLFARHLNVSRGIPVFAVDLSEPMLQIAARNCCGTNVVLLRQDIRSLRLPQRVDLITSNFDTLNHLVGDRDLARTFRAVCENLHPRGYFIFDMVMLCGLLGSAHQYVRQFYSSSRIVTQDVRWEPMRSLLSIVVSIRARNAPRLIAEVHRERAYSPAEIGSALQEAGFVLRGIHDAVTLDLVTTCPPRIVVVARKKSERG